MWPQVHCTKMYYEFIFFYKVKHKLLPSYVVNIFEENETSYQLRNENDFKIPYQGPYLWSNYLV